MRRAPAGTVSPSAQRIDRDAARHRGFQRMDELHGLHLQKRRSLLHVVARRHVQFGHDAVKRRLDDVARPLELPVGSRHLDPRMDGRGERQAVARDGQRSPLDAACTKPAAMSAPFRSRANSIVVSSSSTVMPSRPTRSSASTSPYSSATWSGSRAGRTAVVTRTALRRVQGLTPFARGVSHLRFRPAHAGRGPQAAQRVGVRRPAIG